MAKSLKEMLAAVEATPRPRSVSSIAGGPIIQSGVATESSPTLGAPNSQPLGGLTGAPPQTEIKTVQVIPYTATGPGGGNTRNEPSMVAIPVRGNRVVVVTAPFVGFSIFIGMSNVSPNQGIQLTPAIPYEFVLPGGQALWAVTDAPVYLPLQVQIAPILIGDRERKPE